MRGFFRGLNAIFYTLYFLAAGLLFDKLAHYNLPLIFGADAVPIWESLHIALKIFIAVVLSMVILPITLVVFVLSHFVRTPFF